MNKNLSNETVIHKIVDNVEYIQFRKLLEYEDIITHAYTLKMDNISFKTITEEEKQSATKSYQQLCGKLKLNYINIVKCSQTHTDHIEIVTKKINKNNPDINTKKYENTDALITNKKDLILGTINADCILFLLFDPINKVIANVHSGWRGTLKEIVIKTINKMHDNYNSNYEDIICCICPSIRVCHFEVDKEVKELFQDKFNYLKNINKIIIPNNNDKYNIDTILLNKTLLLNLGLKEENIIDSGICSVCNKDKINSYRAHKPNYKLSTAIITLK